MRSSTCVARRTDGDGAATASSAAKGLTRHGSSQAPTEVDYDLDHVALFSADPEATAREYLSPRLRRRPSRTTARRASRSAARTSSSTPAIRATPERPLLNHLAVLVDSRRRRRADARSRLEVADVVDAPNTYAVFVWGPERVKIEYVEHKPTFSLDLVAHDRRRGDGRPRRGRPRARARRRAGVSRRATAPGGSMLLSSCVVWRHRRSRISAPMPGGRPCASSGWSRAARRGARLARALGVARRRARRPSNPRTDRRRFDPRGLDRGARRAPQATLRLASRSPARSRPLVLATGGFPGDPELARGVARALLRCARTRGATATGSGSARAAAPRCRRSRRVLRARDACPPARARRDFVRAGTALRRVARRRQRARRGVRRRSRRSWSEIDLVAGDRAPAGRVGVVRASTRTRSTREAAGGGRERGEAGRARSRRPRRGAPRRARRGRASRTRSAAFASTRAPACSATTARRSTGSTRRAPTRAGSRPAATRAASRRRSCSGSPPRSPLTLRKAQRGRRPGAGRAPTFAT